jgi:hypothetical protein
MMKRIKIQLFLILMIVCQFSILSAGQNELKFSDDFNRSNSNDVGNGWVESERVSSDIVIQNLAILFQGVSGDSASHWLTNVSQDAANFLVSADISFDPNHFTFNENFFSLKIDGVSGDYVTLNIYPSRTTNELELVYHKGGQHQVVTYDMPYFKKGIRYNLELAAGGKGYLAWVYEVTSERPVYPQVVLDLVSSDHVDMEQLTLAVETGYLPQPYVDCNEVHLLTSPNYVPRVDVTSDAVVTSITVEDYDGLDDLINKNIYRNGVDVTAHVLACIKSGSGHCTYTKSNDGRRGIIKVFQDLRNDLIEVRVMDSAGQVASDTNR